MGDHFAKTSSTHFGTHWTLTVDCHFRIFLKPEGIQWVKVRETKQGGGNNNWSGCVQRHLGRLSHNHRPILAIQENVTAFNNPKLLS
jgi:hypothetical protein